MANTLEYEHLLRIAAVFGDGMKASPPPEDPPTDYAMYALAFLAGVKFAVALRREHPEHFVALCEGVEGAAAGHGPYPMVEQYPRTLAIFAAKVARANE